MKTFIDYFDILGVTPDAGNDEIDRAYRRRIKEAHPDKHDNNDAAVEHAKLLNEARHTLKDAKKRKVYQGRWLLHLVAKQRKAGTTARPKPSARPRHRARQPAPPETKPTVWTPPPPPPLPPPPLSTRTHGMAAGLGGLGFVGLLLGGAYLLSKKNKYDAAVGRYRGRDGTFRSGPWGC
jgi:curved DNA-binding protein CbpA